ncbi:MAG: DUF5018 domain-containing protein [Candidatus Paceibacterota bacterium]|jgi:hypothetical protein
MKNRIWFIFVLVLFFLFCFKDVSASELCSPKGYSIFTVNGILNSEIDAIKNKDKLKSKFPPTYNNEPLIIDYLYNPTHLAGAGDLIDAVKQGLFDQKSDYDLVEMLNDASQKVTTQKVLLVAHSQGNFYANNFYDKVADQEGGVPGQSIGIYGVASPANRVAGGGKYLTSNTDNVIATMVARYIKILSPNIHISLSSNDDRNGHDFSGVYLKYQGDRIVSDIKSSLNKLKDNDEQDSREPCISPPELSTLHKVQGLAFAVADPTANFTKTVAVKTALGSYKIASAIGNGVLGGVNLVANSISSFTKNTKGLVPNNDAGVVLSNGETSSNTNSANPTNSTPKSSIVSQITNKIKTLAMGIVDPNSVSAENNEDSSLPAPVSIPENIDSIDSISSENNTSGSNGGGSGGEVVLPVEPTLDTIPPVVIEPEIIPPVVEPTLVVDIISPVITILGNNPTEIIKDTIYTDAGATALDDIDGVRDVVATGFVDVAVVGTYIITYTATDLSQNIATVTRTVNVVALPVVEEEIIPIIPPVPEEEVLPPLPPTPPPLNTVTINENTTLAPGEYNYDNLIITNNAVLTLEGDPTSLNDFKGVKINAVNITIDAGSLISADGKGYGPNQGPGAGEDVSAISNPGASYGGASSGNSNETIYGSATHPIDLGSGGITYGGGAIRIMVSDTFTNNGIVSVNGNTSSSGGSIYVTAKDIGGSGVFRSNGGGLYAGNYWKSPGAGGRVAIYYQTSSFGGTAEAKGGCGSYDGWSMSCSQNGTVGLFDESANNLYINNYWNFQKNDSPFNFNNIILTGAKVIIDDGTEINASGIILDKASTFTLSGEEIINVGTLSLLGNSDITIIPEKILSLKVSNLNIEKGSTIFADDKGYVNGPGTSEIYGEAGASYGGKGGGATAKPAYGSDVAPADFGSGTEGRRGGGAIRLIVDNNFKNDGIVSASGISERVSGGSIYVTANNISGNGVFKANGGSSSWPYGPIGGGGGRIAIHYKTSDFSGTTNVLSGIYCFYGCAPAGEAGTVKMIDDSIPILPPPASPILSSAKIITTFNFSNLTLNVIGVLDETNHNVSLTVPFSTDVKTLVPTITISEKASINPNTEVAQDFTSPVTYTVTAEDGSTQNYVVAVLITPAPEPEPEPEPTPDITPPSITSYTFNGVAGNITTDPLTNPVSIVLTANEKVNWTSIKIENQDNPSIHKYFYDGANCVNGTDTCTKIWNGETFGGTLQNGIYKIKIKMKDLAGNDFNDYLFPYVITINTHI